MEKEQKLMFNQIHNFQIQIDKNEAFDKGRGG